MYRGDGTHREYRHRWQTRKNQYRYASIVFPPRKFQGRALFPNYPAWFRIAVEAGLDILRISPITRPPNRAEFALGAGRRGEWRISELRKWRIRIFVFDMVDKYVARDEIIKMRDIH